MRDGRLVSNLLSLTYFRSITSALLAALLASTRRLILASFSFFSVFFAQAFVISVELGQATGAESVSISAVIATFSG